MTAKHCRCIYCTIDINVHPHPPSVWMKQLFNDLHQGWNPPTICCVWFMWLPPRQVKHSNHVQWVSSQLQPHFHQCSLCAPFCQTVSLPWCSALHPLHGRREESFDWETFLLHRCRELFPGQVLNIFVQLMLIDNSFTLNTRSVFSDQHLTLTNSLTRC